jgi:hypothetical protein
VHTTPAVPAADMSDNALLVEMMTAVDAVGEDASPAAAQQLTAAFAPAAQENPASLFAIMRGEPCRCGMCAAPR